MAPIPKKPEVNTHAKIPVSQIHALDDLDDPAALQLVVQDTEKTDAWIDAKRWTLRWREADTLYQPPIGVQVWENTTVPRANVIRFTVATHVNSILPKLVNGLFYEDPPFLLRPRSGTKENTTRAIAYVLTAQLDDMDFQEEVRRAFLQALIFGTLIVKWGWKSEECTERKYVRKTPPAKLESMGKVITLPTAQSDQFEVKEFTKTVSRPFWESKDLRFILVDPACRVGDIRHAGFVIERMYLNYYDLEKLADEVYYDADGNEVKRYTLPSREEVRSWFTDPVEAPDQPNAAEQANQNTTLVHHAAPRYAPTCADPLMEPLEVLERWDKGKVITVLQRDRLIRKEKNEFGEIPYNSCNWWDIPDAFYGMGLGRVIGQDQRVQQGLINAMLDVTSLIVNPIYIRNAGANPPTQSIRQRIGGIYDVTGDVDKAFKILEPPRIDPSIFGEIQQSEARAESTSGASELLVQGGMPSQGRTSMGRTATGAGNLQAATESRIGGFIEQFTRQVYEPWLYQMHELNCEKLPLSTLREILGESPDTDFTLDDFKEDDFLNARFKFDVLAGSHLAAKQQMAQSMVMMLQIFENQQMLQQLQAQGKKVDIEELFHMIHDLSGWKNYYQIIRPMSPEDQQRAIAMNPAVIAAQSKAATEDKKAKNKKEEIDQKAEANLAGKLVAKQQESTLDRATAEIERQALQKAGTSLAVAGTPGGQGFGTTEA